jgi:hypothetical protein
MSVTARTCEPAPRRAGGARRGTGLDAAPSPPARLNIAQHLCARSWGPRATIPCIEGDMVAGVYVPKNTAGLAHSCDVSCDRWPPAPAALPRPPLRHHHARSVTRRGLRRVTDNMRRRCGMLHRTAAVNRPAVNRRRSYSREEARLIVRFIRSEAACGTTA